MSRTLSRRAFLRTAALGAPCVLGAAALGRGSLMTVVPATLESAASTSEKDPCPWSSSTLTATTPASRETDRHQVTIPDTAVPCPSSSSAALPVECVGPPPGQQPRAGTELSPQKQRCATRLSTSPG